MLGFHFATHQKQTAVLLSLHLKNIESQARLFGVTVHDNFSWAAHIDAIQLKNRWKDWSAPKDFSTIILCC